MRFNILPLLCLVGSALALPANLVARDSAIIERYLGSIINKMGRLDDALRAVPRGGSADEARRITSDLVRYQQDLIEEYRLGARDVRRGPAAGVLDAPRLSEPWYNMGLWLQSNSNGWISAKDMVTAAGKKGEVLDLLMTASEASIVFDEACIAKVAGAGTLLGNWAKSQHGQYIEAAITQYKK
jgi:hypothetical protein